MIVRLAELTRDALADARALLGRACRFDRAADVAEEKLFGMSPAPIGAGGEALGAWAADGALAGVAVVAARWLRLLAVDPAARGRGVGTALLEAATARARAGGAAVLRTMDQPGNYLAPGVDERDVDTLGWLERRGFRRVGANENLRVPLADNPLVTPARAAEMAARAAAAGYEVRRARLDEAGALVNWVLAAFGRAWAFEVERALAVAPPAVHVARGPDGALAAFAAHDGNNRGLGWFGPAGTLPEHRGKGLGAALLLPCLLDVAAAGQVEGVIAWIGPRDFYARAAGAVSDRRFVVLEKDLA